MTDALLIRAATAADVPAIANIVDQAYRHYIARIGRPPGPMLDDYPARVSEGAVWVFEEGTVLAAVIVLLPAPNYLLLDNIAISPRPPELRFGPRAAGFRGDGGIAARLSRNPALHASNDGGKSAPLRLNRI
jgi:hypothetical protein